MICSIFLILVMTGCGAAQPENNSQKQTGENSSQEQTGENNSQEQTEEDGSQVQTEESRGEAYAELSEGSAAPDFTADTAGGSVFTLSDKENKVILLNFWASWCGPCVGEMPALQKLYEEYGEETEILAVNVLEDRAVVDAFIEESGYTFPIAYDDTGEVGNKYPTDGIPYTVIIGKDGKVSALFVGSKGAEEQYKVFRSALDEALAK